MVTTLRLILKKLSKLQNRILLVYRPTEKSSWADRVLYESKEFDPLKKYNHRNILFNEIVIEFDEDSYKQNRIYADVVRKRLAKDKISSVSWYSGNKSVHLHFFVNVGKCSNVQLLKKVVMRYYTQNLIKPDLRLASDNHLIRAEFGVHEKSGRYKKPIKWTVGFPKICELPKLIWDLYAKEYKAVLRRRQTTEIKEVTEHPDFKNILASEEFRKYEDGRERALFMLIHLLKPKYQPDRKEELIKFLIDWYKYAGGYKLSEQQIKHKVNYHWVRTYNIGLNYLRELIEELGGRA